MPVQDRVESSPEQMAGAAALAERLSRETRTRTRVVGWYHSHPHITVLPSHVDVRTQATYQLLDQGFVGLIFSVFNSDGGKSAGHVQVTAFQSQPASAASSAGSASGGAAAAAADGYSEGQRRQQAPSAWGGAHVGGQHLTSAEYLRLDSGMREAMQASADAALQGGADGLVRREVPLAIVPSAGVAEASLADYASVQRIIYLEEKEAYDRAVAAAAQKQQQAGQSDGGRSDLLHLHRASGYQAALCRMLETALSPAAAALEATLHQQQVQARQLQQQNEALRQQLRQLSQSQ